MICQMILKLIQFLDLQKEYIKQEIISIRIMKWLVRDIYVNNINYYDLIGTALTYMKEEKLYVSKELFALINE